MSQLVWKNGQAVGPNGLVVYTIQVEHTRGEPPAYDPWFLDMRGQWQNIPTQFITDGWPTRSRARAACERHYRIIHKETEK